MRTGAFRALLWVIAAFWLFDRGIFILTDAQWFASLGYGAWWWQRVAAQTELFLGFFAACFLLSVVFMKAVVGVAVPDTLPLRGTLANFESWRGRAMRVGWLVLIVFALLLARSYARQWPALLVWRGGDAVHYTASFGLPVGLWTRFLPLFAPFLGALWDFSLLLFLVVGATGTLRALPRLAARQPSPPLELTRTLWRLGAFVLLLRALGYVEQVFCLAQGKPLQSGDLFVLAPLFLLGALGCLVLGLSCLRSARRLWRPRISKLIFAIAAAFVVPGILAVLTFPLRALCGETHWLRSQRLYATRAAWGLNFAEMVPLSASKPGYKQAAWPVWDEERLLGAERGAAFQESRKVVSWDTATLNFDGHNWNALLAGIPAGATAINARRDADGTTALETERLDWNTEDGSLSRTPLGSLGTYYGIEGHNLMGDGDSGVSIRSIAWKWAWAWRLRDILLPFDGASASRLLVYRGALERAQILAPFWKVAGEPQLVTQGEKLLWMVPLCVSNDDFPGAMNAVSGDFAGQNTALDAVTMTLDARSGAVEFYAMPCAPGMVNDLPRLVRPASQMPAALKAKRRPSLAILRSKLDLEVGLRGWNGARLYGPTPSANASGEIVWITLAVRQGQIAALETPSDGSLPNFRIANFDFDARLRDIESVAGPNSSSDPTNLIEPGDPAIWPDTGAPGGWWVGRAYFSSPRQDSPIGGNGTKLWRVAITGASVSQVGYGQSLREAPIDFLRRSTPASGGSALPLEIQALQAFESGQVAIKKGDWPAYGRAAALEKALLERLAQRR